MNDPKLIEAVARALAEADGCDPDFRRPMVVPVIVAGRLSDTGHDARVTERRDALAEPMWRRYMMRARAAITAYEAARGDGVAEAVADALFHGSGAVLMKADGSAEHIDRRAMIAAAKGE